MARNRQSAVGGSPANRFQQRIQPAARNRLVETLFKAWPAQTCARILCGRTIEDVVEARVHTASRTPHLGVRSPQPGNNRNRRLFRVTGHRGRVPGRVLTNHARFLGTPILSFCRLAEFRQRARHEAGGAIGLRRQDEGGWLLPAARSVLGWPTCEVCSPCLAVSDGGQSVTSLSHIDVVRVRTGISPKPFTPVTRPGTRLGGRIRPGWGGQ